MSNSGSGGGIIGLILGILLIMLVAAVMGIDTCTCGYGPEIHSSIKDMFK